MIRLSYSATAYYSRHWEDVMKNDEDSIPKKYDLDLDELSDDKPIAINAKKFKPENRVDFTKTSEQNEGRYISVGQIEELTKMPKDEKNELRAVA